MTACMSNTTAGMRAVDFRHTLLDADSTTSDIGVNTALCLNCKNIHLLCLEEGAYKV